jgi:hypothetical protein
VGASNDEGKKFLVGMVMDHNNYEDTFNDPPTGYVLNNSKISNFHILVGDRLY